MPEAQANALREALVSLDGSNPEHAEVLAAFAAKTFVPARPEAWDGIRDVLIGLEAAGALK